MSDDDLPLRPSDEEEPADTADERLIRAEIERLKAMTAEEEAAEDELAKLELAYHSVEQAVADAAAELADARAELERLKLEAARTTAEHAAQATRIERAQREDSNRLDAALGEMLRLAQGRFVAEAQMETATAELDMLREEYEGQEALVDQAEAAVAELKAKRLALEAERREVEKAVTAETERLAQARERLARANDQREVALRAMAEDAALAEVAAVLDAAAASVVDDDDAAGRVLPGTQRFVVQQPVQEPALVGAGASGVHRLRWSANASWNAAFAVFSVLVALLGVKTLVDGPPATEAFCAEAPRLDEEAAREALDALAGGASAGTAFAPFEQGRYAYTTTSQVSDEVREAADRLEAAHAAVAERKGEPTRPAQYERLGQAVFDADADLRSTCETE